MSVKQVKTMLLLLTVVIVSTAIILLDTTTSKTQSASAIDKPGVWSKPVDSSRTLPVVGSPQTPLKKGGFRKPPLSEGGVWGGSDRNTFDRIHKPGMLPPLETADKTPTEKSELHQRFQLRPSISQRIRVPPVIRSIPEQIPQNISQIIGKLLEIESPIYVQVTSATSSRYEAILGYEKNCQGGTACRVGMISAEKLIEAANIPPGEEESLEEGMTGYFVDASCGANCSDATISWDDRGSRYTLGIKVGKKETLVKMADVKLRKLVKGLQELLTQPGFLRENMGIYDRLMERRETDEGQLERKTVAAVKPFGESKSKSLIANGAIADYRDSLLKASKQILPNIRRYAVLRLSDGINYDEDEVVEDVKTLQNLLMKEGFLETSELDGMFGPSTLNAVKNFQDSRGLVADGIVGEETWSALWNEPVEVYLPYDNLIASLYLDEIVESIPRELGLRPYAWESIPLILWECDRSGVSDFGQIAYILATAEHESGLGKWMEEFASGWAYEGRSDLGNYRRGDGPRYKGRGFVQITGRRNYTYWSRRLGIDLVNFPEKAADPEIAAKILVRGMRDGTFTRDHWLSKYIRGYWRDFYYARRIVNGLDRAAWIEAIAKAYYKVL